LTKFQIESRDFQIESQIESQLVQIESLVLKSNRQKRFNRDLNRIAIWICPPLATTSHRHIFQPPSGQKRATNNIFLQNNEADPARPLKDMTTSTNAYVTWEPSEMLKAKRSNIQKADKIHHNNYGLGLGFV